MAALIADVQMTAQLCGTTGYDIPEGMMLLGRQPVALNVGIPVNPEDIGDLDVRSHQPGLGAYRLMRAHRCLPESLTLRGADQVQGTFCSAYMRGADLGISGRCSNRSVPQEHLNGTNIRAGFEQMSGKGVSEQMGGDMLRQAGGLSCPAKGFAYRGVTDGLLRLLTWKEPRPARTSLLVVGSQKEQEPLAEHDVAIASSLAVSNVDKPSSAVDVGNLKRAGLGDPQAGAVGGHQNRPMLDGDDLSQEFFDLRSA